MTLALAWIAALGGAAATIGTWLGPLRARWQLRAETIRDGRDRRENELHRRRLTETWHQWNDMPAGPERTEAARWYTEWTGAVAPRRGGIDPGPQAPGFGCADAADAYNRYVEFLGYRYEPLPQPGSDIPGLAD